jgi:hypothetical protein
MQCYRAFHLDRDGHVIDRVDLNCTDDKDAKQQAKQLVIGYDVELWQLDRKIALFNCKPGPQ